MRGHRYFTEFLPTWSTSRLERGWYQTTNATKGLPYSPVNLTPTGSIHASTIGAHVGGNRNLSQGWGTSPQLNWRLPTNATKGHNATKATNRLGFQEPKRDKLQGATQTKSSEENSNRCTKCKWQEHHKDAQIPHSQVPTKLPKLLGEQERSNQRETQNPPKSRSPKIHSQRDVLVWSKHRSGSPPTTPQIYARINGGMSINQAQRVRQMGAKLRQKEEEEATLNENGQKTYIGLDKIWPLEHIFSLGRYYRI